MYHKNKIEKTLLEQLFDDSIRYMVKTILGSKSTMKKTHSITAIVFIDGVDVKNQVL